MEGYTLKQLQRLASLAGIPYNKLRKIELYQRLITEELLFEPLTRVTVRQTNDQVEMIELPYQVASVVLDDKVIYLVTDDGTVHSRTPPSSDFVQLLFPATKQLLIINNVYYLLGTDHKLYQARKESKSISNQMQFKAVEWWSTEIEYLDGDEHGLAWLAGGTLYLRRLNKIETITSMITINDINKPFKYRYGLLGWLEGGVLMMKGSNPEGRVIGPRDGTMRLDEKLFRGTLGMTGPLDKIVEFDFGVYHRLCRDSKGRMYGWGTALDGELLYRDGCHPQPHRIPLDRPIDHLLCDLNYSYLFVGNKLYRSNITQLALPQERFMAISDGEISVYIEKLSER